MTNGLIIYVYLLFSDDRTLCDSYLERDEQFNVLPLNITFRIEFLELVLYRMAVLHTSLSKLIFPAAFPYIIAFCPVFLFSRFL